MDNQTMQLLELPTEVVEAILAAMIPVLGLYKAVRVRLVCKLFDRLLVNAIFEGSWIRPDLYPRCAFIPRAFLGRYLVSMTARDTRRKTTISYLIHKAARMLEDCEPNVEDVENPVPFSTSEERLRACREGLCQAMARHQVSVEAAVNLASSQVLADYEEENQTGLVAAAAIGDIGVLKNCISKLPNSHGLRRSRFFGAAWRAAVVQGHTEVIRVLSKRGSTDPEIMTNVLVEACREGHVGIVEFSLDYWGPDAALDKALDNAIRNHHDEIVALLLKQMNLQTLLNGRRKRMYHVAADAGYEALVQFMLDKGISINSMNYSSGYGRTALQQAALKGRTGVVQLILDQPSAHGDKNLGDALIMAASNGHEQIVQMLLDAGVDINWKGSDIRIRPISPSSYFTSQGPPVHAASRNNEIHMMQYLLDRGADVNADNRGAMALKLTCQRGHELAARKLVEFGVDPDGIEDGFAGDSAMLWALRVGQDHVVRTLLSLGAKEVKPSDSIDAAKFASGEYPMIYRD